MSYEYKLVKLKFVSSFKIGEENYIDSITIYRALIKSLSELGYDFTSLLDGKIKFSSIFPLINNKLYLKMPYKKVKCDNDRTLEKDLKNLEYINYEILEKYQPPYELNCKGSKAFLKDINNNELELLNDKNEIINDFLKGSEVIENNVRYRNRIDRITGSADPFTYFAHNYKTEVGFLATDWNENLEKGIKLLEQVGFGSDKNVGYGKFKFLGVSDLKINVKYDSKLKYVTGRAYAEGEIGKDIFTERFDKVTVFAGGETNKVIAYMVLLPVGSLAKNVNRKTIFTDNNYVIIDPITIQ